MYHVALNEHLVMEAMQQPRILKRVNLPSRCMSWTRSR